MQVTAGKNRGQARCFPISRAGERSEAPILFPAPIFDTISRMPHSSIAEYVKEFRHDARDVALVDRKGYRVTRWTYLQIAYTAAQVAREFERLGIKKGDHALLWGDCAEWVAAFYGCVLSGVVAIPLDQIAAPEFVQTITRQVRARVAFGPREQLHHLRQVTGTVLIPFEDFPDRIATHSFADYPGPLLGPTDVLEILFTSGATGAPKGVVITHGNVLSNLEPLKKGISNYLKYERIFHPIRFLNLVPLSHVFGQFMGMFVPQLLRATVLIGAPPKPSDVIRTIRRERVSVLVAVPRTLDSLKDHIEREYEMRGELVSLRARLESAAEIKFLKRWVRFRRVHSQFGWKFWAVVSGGAALDSATEEFWRRLGYVVVQGYGMTETTSLISVNHPFGVQRGSIGKPLPGREMKIDESGEILVRGDNIASAYWQDGEMKPVANEDGWLRTGDLGALDASGNLYFKGRKKNVIVTPEGMNVYPQDLENALRAQPGVKDCLILPFPRGGNAVPGAVLLLSGPTVDAAGIVGGANELLAEYQHIRQWFVWPEDDFPRTSTQKPKSNVILQFVLSHLDGTSNPAGAGSSGSVAEFVAQVTRRSAEKLSELSSLERVELMSALEDRFQVDLNESKFTAVTTLADLEQMFHAPSERTDFLYPRWVQRWPVPWIRRAVYCLLAWPATQILSRPRIEGGERLRSVHGPVLVICNHVTYLDAGFVLAALPHRLRDLAIAMEGERVQRMRRPPEEWPWLTRLAVRAGYWLMTPLFHAFPLPQRAGFRESFRFAGEAADKGYGVLVFPEGMRTPDGKIQPFRNGIGLLASNLNLPVVPMRIHGLWEVKKSGRRGFAPWGAIRVNVGEPIRFATGSDPAEITRTLEGAVRSL
jgi:long-chain acyl-CoA synthetase